MQDLHLVSFYLFYCMHCHTIYTDGSLIVGAGDGESNAMEVASIRLPQSVINITDRNDNNISLGYTLYNKAVLFPVRDTNIIVGSSVISASIGGVIDGTELPDPVVVSLVLKTKVNNTMYSWYKIKSYSHRLLLILAVLTGTLQLQVLYILVGTSFLYVLILDGRGNWSTRGCNTTFDPANNSVACHCNHLTNFACLVVSIDLSAY